MPPDWQKLLIASGLEVSPRSSSEGSTMRVMSLRRLLALLAAPALVLGLAACGPDDSADAPPAEDSPSQEQTPTEEDSPAEASPTEEDSPAEESPTEKDSSSEEDPTEDESPDEETGNDDPDSEGTALETRWIDDSWTIEQVDEDLCEMGGGYPSQYSEQEELFVCGPTAIGAKACALDDGTVQCIVDPVGKQAIEFDSSTAPEQPQPREDEALPLLVELPDGAVCTTIAHDHDQHWNGMFSWYRCDDGSELLTPEEIDDTFERGEPWTVQRSVDQGEPEATAVTTAVFAGR